MTHIYDASQGDITSNLFLDCIDGVMVSMLASSAGDGGFEPRSGQTKD
jgi:hypothetical protein